MSDSTPNDIGLSSTPLSYFDPFDALGNKGVRWYRTQDIKSIDLLLIILSSKQQDMIKRLLLIAVGLITTLAGFAQTPVWSTDVAPILYSNCVSCHRTGGAAPFELIT
jgi:hypothetical protein